MKKFNLSTVKLASLLPHNPEEENSVITAIHNAVLDGADETHTFEVEAEILTHAENYGFTYAVIVQNVQVGEEAYNQIIKDEESNSMLCYIFNIEHQSTDLCVVEYDFTKIPFLDFFNKLPEYLKVQHTLNVLTSGEHYLATGVCEKTGKYIDFDLCIKMELCELKDTTPWKHWKDGKFLLSNESIDHTNIKVEQTDILHFILSRLLEIGYFNTERELPGQSNTVDDYINHITTMIDYEQMFLGMINNINQIALLKDEDTMCSFFEYVISQWIKSASNTAMDLQQFLIVNLLLEKMYGFDFIEIYKMYIGKNALNKFRLDHGYTEDVYVKIWECLDKPGTDDYIAKEDNYFMNEFVKELSETDELSFDNIYLKLENKYQKVIANNKPMKANDIGSSEEEHN